MGILFKLWNLIVQSNTFNFILLAVIIAVVSVKLNIIEMLNRVKDEIVKRIEDSNNAKNDAKSALTDARSRMIHLDEEISERLKLAEKQADNVAAMIQESAEKKIVQIKENTQKVIQSEEKTIVTLLNDSTALDSVEQAESFIIQMLENNPELHNRFIEESIEEIKKAAL